MKYTVIIINNNNNNNNNRTVKTRKINVNTGPTLTYSFVIMSLLRRAEKCPDISVKK
jgi:hypothetical protein